ncbi:hypothetical protein F2P81_011226 [Scophthalmus maximus]|uniref:Uncharacterized protein n=1 Tax=Scophthalmus maximus TaxID=52904 RepID=A0A6A4SXZ0_SCOMX|nr:hypothetical protein F2P81_011226 [Scophthalmus maximus]
MHLHTLRSVTKLVRNLLKCNHKVTHCSWKLQRNAAEKKNTTMNGKVASESGVASGLLRISDDEVINFNSHLDINSGGIDDDAFTDETSEWPKNRPAQIN